MRIKSKQPKESTLEKKNYKPKEPEFRYMGYTVDEMNWIFLTGTYPKNARISYTDSLREDFSSKTIETTSNSENAL
jgi:hypothetical protein